MSEGAVFAWAIVWIAMAVACSVIAENKGFNAGSWFLLGLIVWPIALLAVLIKPSNAQADEQHALARGEMKKCPECAELVRAEATKCRFCGHVFTQRDDDAREREELEFLAQPRLRDRR